MSEIEHNSHGEEFWFASGCSEASIGVALIIYPWDNGHDEDTNKRNAEQAIGALQQNAADAEKYRALIDGIRHIDDIDYVPLLSEPHAWITGIDIWVKGDQAQAVLADIEEAQDA